ncbi:MAG: RtcB family protein [Asticcacaulis sp.]
MSRSRGIGNRIGSYFIERAKHEMKRWFISLPDEDLAYLPEGSDLFGDYMGAAVRARQPRTDDDGGAGGPLHRRAEALHLRLRSGELPPQLRGARTALRLGRAGDPQGAVRITVDTFGIIPGSMGAKSFIVRGIDGQAAAEALCSCSHGAGRAMSRNEAKRRFTVEDHIAATAGVECRKDADVIDETPAALQGYRRGDEGPGRPRRNRPHPAPGGVREGVTTN